MRIFLQINLFKFQGVESEGDEFVIECDSEESQSDAESDVLEDSNKENDGTFQLIFREKDSLFL